MYRALTSAALLTTLILAGCAEPGDRRHAAGCDLATGTHVCDTPSIGPIGAGADPATSSHSIYSGGVGG